MIKNARPVVLCLCLAAGATAAWAEPSVEVLHWWGSSNEGGAARVIEDAFKKAGGRWSDVPVSGGGEGEMKVLQARVLSGNPPNVAMMHAGKNVWNWGEQSALVDIDEVAKKEGWDALLPPFIADMVKYRGKYVAVPTDVHRLNTLFVNAAVLKKAGVVVTPGWPRDWDEFNAAAEKIRKIGLIPLVGGGEPWQEVIVFDAVVLGVGGPVFYKQALVDLDPKALGGPVMVKVFDQMRKLHDPADRGRTGRGTQLTTQMVVRGEAAMQIMGDWAKAEFLAAGKTPEKDFLCLPTPGSAKAFVGVTDAFAMFKVSGKDQAEGQKLFASVMMGKDAQRKLSLAKGSIPPRLDVSKEGFDVCARRAMADFKEAGRSGKMLSDNGAMSNQAVAGAIFDVVTRHFNSDMPSAEAAKLLGEAVQGAK